MTNPSRRAASHDRKRRAGSELKSMIDDNDTYRSARSHAPSHPRVGSEKPVASPAIGDLELRAYKDDWLQLARFRRGVRADAAVREKLALAEKLKKDALAAAAKLQEKFGKPKRGKGFGALRKAAAKATSDDGDDTDRLDVAIVRDPRPFPAYPVSPAKIAARLILARMLDTRPDLKKALRDGSPVVVLDVPDPEMLDRVVATWESAILEEGTRVLKMSGNGGKREDYDLLHIVVKEPTKGTMEAEREKQALAALSLALPIVAISPAAETHLPKAVLKAAPIRIAFPPLDPITIARCIRVATGRACRDLLDDDTAMLLTASDLIVAIRFDRTPAECIEELRRIAGSKRTTRSGRNIPMDDLHGLEEAVAWARMLKVDLDAWRREELSWSALSAGACLVGPPGTGKTLFAQTLSTFLSSGSCRVPLIECSLAQWQGADEGHLGHLLRAMRRDFEQARARAPSILFIDEIDSFADRSKIKHTHADYVVEVVNALLAQLDGAASREGLICVGASNDIGRCDPAILRPGRLGKIIRINLPTEQQLERMFRVRLDGRLAKADLSEICMLALGSTGAEVERITNDALRFARHAGRPLALSDLRDAITGTDDRDAADLRRAAIHEAGHLVSDIVLFGNEADVHANIAAIGIRGGYTTRTKAPAFAGTYHDYVRRLQVLLAGRAAEELLLGAASHGAGGRQGSDLQVAASMAAGMCASLGIAGPSKLLYLGDFDRTEDLLSYPEVREATYRELAKAEKAVSALLSDRKVALEEIAAKLLRDKRMDGPVAASILTKHRRSTRAVRSS
jgi:ATP-dependent Zn protease